MTEPTPEQLKAAEENFLLVNRAFAGDTMLRLSRQALFVANRMSMLTIMVMRHRLRAAGVEQPELAVRAMLNDQALVQDTIGEFELQHLHDLVEQALPLYIPMLHEMQITLADIDPSYVERNTERGPGDPDDPGPCGKPGRTGNPGNQ